MVKSLISIGHNQVTSEANSEISYKNCFEPNIWSNMWIKPINHPEPREATHRATSSLETAPSSDAMTVQHPKPGTRHISPSPSTSKRRTSDLRPTPGTKHIVLSGHTSIASISDTRPKPGTTHIVPFRQSSIASNIPPSRQPSTASISDTLHRIGSRTAAPSDATRTRAGSSSSEATGAATSIATTTTSPLGKSAQSYVRRDSPSGTKARSEAIRTYPKQIQHRGPVNNNKDERPVPLKYIFELGI